VFKELGDEIDLSMKKRLEDELETIESGADVIEESYQPEPKNDDNPNKEE